jgi:hypothetical protein
MMLCIFLAGFLSFNMAAQLSGVVTIDNTGLPVAPNYTSFTALAADLNTQGINAPLTVNVAAGTGPYNEQVNFGVINGTSATNTITINGNNCQIVFNATVNAAPHTFMLSGADHMNVHRLEMAGTNTINALVCHLWNSSDYNSFNSCTITAGVNATNSNVRVVPVSVSGTSVSATAAGAGGNENIWENCLISGGYHGATFYSNTSGTFMTGNKMINNEIRNFYENGIVTSYVADHLIRGNVFEKPNQTSFTTSYAININTATQRTIIEKNHIRNCFAMTPTSTSTFYGINVTAAPSAGNENIIRNNLFSDMNGNGTQYGINVTGANNQVIHNTISFDNAASTAGTTYGIYCTAASMIMNNVITVTRGGNGTKYCLYYTNTNIVSNTNVLYIKAPAGTNNIAYWNSAVSSLTAWKAVNGAKWDQQSVDLDPLYTMPGANYAPTEIGVNNLGTPAGVTDDFNGTTRSLSSPDPGAFEIFTTNCFGNPGITTITAPTGTWCPGTAFNLALAASVYSNSGISYQWVSSTTSVIGPFTAVTGETLTSMRTSSLTDVTTYYSVIVSCAGGGSVTVPAVTLDMVPLVTSVVPYFEGFESLSSQNLLPNCYWAVSNAATALTQTTSNPNGRIPYEGNNFAMFVNSPAGTNYFYSNGIQLQPGITYSASIWWLTESVGHTNWTDLSILVGTSQSPVGQQVVASTNGPAVSASHKLLGGTFTVPATGVYYISIRGTSTSGSAQYLSFDNLRVDIPCALNGPSVTLSTLSNTVCAEKPLSISAFGADTYTWNTGEHSAAITVTPNGNTNTYVLQATRLLSGCTSTFSQVFTVLPSPVLYVFASSDEICSGSEVKLQALAQNVVNYSWYHGATTALSVVQPTATTTYSVMAINNYGCNTVVSKEITVNPLPNVQLSSTAASAICEGEPVTLTGRLAAGVGTYSWVSNTAMVYMGNPLTLYPTTSLMFTLTGTDAKGCSGKVFYNLTVDACTGLDKQQVLNGLSVYPNPSAGVITVEMHTLSEKQIEVTDVTGRVILSLSSVNDKTQVDTSVLPAGVYYVKVRSAETSAVVKIMKD